MAWRGRLREGPGKWTLRSCREEQVDDRWGGLETGIRLGWGKVGAEIWIWLGTCLCPAGSEARVEREES